MSIVYLCQHLLIQSHQLKHRVKCHSDVSIVNSAANLEHAIIRRYISLKVSKGLTVLRHSMLAEIVSLTALP